MRSTRIRDRAIRRAGELLKQIEPAKPGPKPEIGVGAHTELGRQVAGEKAGLSKHQQVQAIRVANISFAEVDWTLHVSVAIVDQPWRSTMNRYILLLSLILFPVEGRSQDVPGPAAAAMEGCMIYRLTHGNDGRSSLKLIEECSDDFSAYIEECMQTTNLEKSSCLLAGASAAYGTTYRVTGKYPEE
ncbi:hypothetical protein GCM10007923_55490 [Shinella yambaruensis]|uniref:DUF4189 domain-containing protein n=1 Tax=Shinella yambaruensis TaxID=415996 RepID=A0ABQ5ZRI2_9HYPH|nr:hypothetical protein GCM10007923_55490 [Shinella yambaruensis]